MLNIECTFCMEEHEIKAYIYVYGIYYVCIQMADYLKTNIPTK